MKQYTTPEQTAKLIELGFEWPKSIYKYILTGRKSITRAEPILRYSIGELIEILPSHIGRWQLDIFHNLHFECWTVCIDPEKHTTSATELVDALYAMIMKLKEEGVV